MLIGIIYFCVIIFSCTLGALSGIGGGLIIRPVFDAIGYHDVASISFYSSVAVFTMATISIICKTKTVSIPFDSALLAACGGVLGGVLGNALFQTVLHHFPQESNVASLQTSLIILTLGFSFFCTVKKPKTFGITRKTAYFFIGIFLGTLASFLGIGGGPINVAVFMLLCGISIKEATAISIITIFFSQLSKLLSIGIFPGFQAFDLTVLYYVISAALIGGICGSKLGHLLSEKAVIKVYQAVTLSVIALNFANLILSH